MTHIKYIYWFAYFNEKSPSVRYRGKYPLEYFKQNHGIDSTLVVPNYTRQNIFTFLKCYFSALLFRKKNSVIVIQRVHSSFIYGSLLKLLVTIQKKHTVYDLDDADYLDWDPKSIYFFARKCSHVTAGSQAIANHLAKHNNNIVFTTSPTLDLGIVKKKRSEIFTIGWIGDYGGDHKNSLIELVFPAVKMLEFDCKLKILGVGSTQDAEEIKASFNDHTHVELEIPIEIDWSNESQLQESITTFDVGIATLVDNEIQRSKSGIKAKQYLNNGVPVLGTNLPENNWVIKDHHNGFYCASRDDFKRRMSEFKQMSNEEYDRFILNARASISAFDHKKYYTDFLQILEKPTNEQL